MESLEPTGDATDTKERRFFSEFEIGIAECLRGTKLPSVYAAQNAIFNLKKAWELRDIDSQMAAFRAITAEEEAATAIFLVSSPRFAQARTAN